MILDKFCLNGKVAVVTGGTKGIGKAITFALAEAGADIAVVSRSPHNGVEKAILALGRRYIHHSADFTKREQTKTVIPTVVQNMGGEALISWSTMPGSSGDRPQRSTLKKIGMIP